MTEYNLYCDESCHLEHDDSDVMVLGALIIPKDKGRKSQRIFSRSRHVTVSRHARK